MIGAGAIVGLLAQIMKINNLIVFCSSSMVLGVLFMFYDPCFCF
jgi:hypothetical protein